jgi:hypothetical protein
MEEPRVMPSTIDYSSMLPMSVPAMASRRKFFPSNGSTFSRIGNNQIRIELAHGSALLDSSHSYLDLNLRNTGANTLGLDLGGTNCLFESVRVEQGGRLLSYTQASNRLHAAILAPVQMTSEGVSTGGITEFQRGYNTNIAASIAPSAAGQPSNQYDIQTHNGVASIAAAANIRLTMPITSGLFSQDKLIPLPLVDPMAPITIVLELGNDADAGVWSAPPLAGELVITECAYVAHLVEVGPDVINQFRMVQQAMGGQLVISGQDYEYFSGALPAGTAGQATIACPVRKKSVKSFYWCSQSNDYANTAGPIVQSAAYNLSFAGSANIDSFQFRVGPLLYPPTPVQCWGQTLGAPAVGAEFNRAQACMELAKSVGTMSKTNPTGILSTTSYGADLVGLASGENGIGGATHVPITDSKICVCPFGITTDSFMRDVVESGLDTETLAQDSVLELNWAAGVGSAGEDQIVHIWCLFDQHYYFNMDGSVTYSA